MLSMLFEEYWSELLLVNNLYIGSILIVILFCDNNKSCFNMIYGVY